MTEPVAPPDEITVPPYPALGATDFNQLAWNYGNAMPGIALRLGQFAQNAYTNALASKDKADISLGAAVTATAARDVAVAAANFKGNWSDLAGALNMPACVRHAGRFWVLLANLTNVAAAQPGVSASWAALDAGTVPSQLLNTAGATVNAVPGVRYLFAANNIVLNAPTTSVKGDYHGWRRMAGVTGCTWVLGTAKVRGGTPGTLAVDMQGIDLFYEDTTQGLI